MKKLIAICLTILCLTPAALAAEVEPEVIPFTQEGMETYRGSCTLKDGSLVLASNTTKDMAGMDVPLGKSLGWLICLDPSGKTVWERRDGEAAESSVYVSPILLDDGRIMAGFIRETDGYETRQWISRVFSTQGELLAEYPMEGQISSVLPAGDGYVADLYNSDDKRVYRYVRWDGTTVWDLNNDNLRANAVIAQSDGLVLVGMTYETEKSQPIAVKVLDNGSVQWTQVLQLAPSGRLTSGLVTHDGKLLLAGGLCEGEAAWAFVVCLGADGTLLWKRDFKDDAQLQLINDIAMYQDGYLALSEYRSRSRLWIGLMDADGQLTKSQLLQTPDTTYMQSQLRFLGGQPVVCSGADVSEAVGQPVQMLVTRVDIP